VIAALIPAVTSILGKVVQDKDQAAQLAADISTLAERHAQEQVMAQLEINKEEAKGNWFQSSWRPLTGYVCVLGFAVNFLVSPIAFGFGIVIPQADTGTMMPVLMGLLGLGGMRSFERVKKVGK